MKCMLLGFGIQGLFMPLWWVLYQPGNGWYWEGSWGNFGMALGSEWDAGNSAMEHVWAIFRTELGCFLSGSCELPVKVIRCMSQEWQNYYSTNHCHNYLTLITCADCTSRNTGKIQRSAVYFTLQLLGRPNCLIQWFQSLSITTGCLGRQKRLNIK